MGIWSRSAIIQYYDGFDHILITHGHFDHIMDLPEIIARNPATKIHFTQTPYRTLIRKGISEQNLVMLSYGQTFSIHDFRISTFHGKHAIIKILPRIPGMLASSHRNNLFCIFRENRVCKENDETVFYHIESEGKAVSIMGSLNLREDVEYPTHADFLVLPYNGWDDNYPPAVQVIEMLQPKSIVLDHYDDTFPPATGKVDLYPILERYPGRVTALTIGRSEVV